MNLDSASGDEDARSIDPGSLEEVSTIVDHIVANGHVVTSLEMSREGQIVLDVALHDGPGGANEVDRPSGVRSDASANRGEAANSNEKARASTSQKRTCEVCGKSGFKSHHGVRIHQGKVHDTVGGDAAVHSVELNEYGDHLDGDTVREAFTRAEDLLSIQRDLLLTPEKAETLAEELSLRDEIDSDGGPSESDVRDSIADIEFVHSDS